jgi:RNA polymerase sigma factor (TIGR02999 family)
MSRERAEHTLQPTELVHEAWLRLIKSGSLGDSARPEFMAMAATAMRRILIEHARMRSADKRSRQRSRSLEFDPVDPGPADYLLALDEHLLALGEQDESLGRIVELRFFAGLNVEETAEAMQISTRTVKRGWRLARAWLQSKIENEAGDGS